MAVAAIITRIMPESPSADLDEIQATVKSNLESLGAMNISFTTEPIAFGLKAIIVGFEQDENEGELDPIENALNKIKNVSSVQIIDMRRAL